MAQARAMEAKFQELRLMLGGLSISAVELRSCLALVDECEQYSSPSTLWDDLENCKPSARNADLSVSCISNASTIVLSPAGHDGSLTNATSSSEYGDVLGDLPPAPAAVPSPSGLLQFGVSPSPSLTANAIKRRRRAHKNDADSSEPSSSSPLPCTQVSLEDEGREAEGGIEESPEKDETAEKEGEGEEWRKEEKEVVAQADVGMEVTAEVETKEEEEAGNAGKEPADEIAVLQEPPHLEGDKMEEEEAKAAPAEAPQENHQQQQQMEEAAGYAAVLAFAEPVVDVEYRMDEADEMPAPRLASEKRRNPRRQSVSGKRLNEGAQARNRAAILSSSSAAVETEEKLKEAVETCDKADLPAPIQAPPSPHAPAPTPHTTPRPSSPPSAVTTMAPPFVLSVTALAIAETAVAPLATSPAIARSLALALVAALSDALPATEPAALSSLALTTHALCVLLLPPAPSAEAQTLSHTEAPPAKRRRVAFLTAAGCSSSPPNDRRPESFLNTMADAQRLHQALGLCDELAALPLPGGHAEGSGRPLVEALVRVAALPGLDREAAGLARIISEELQPRLDGQQSDEDGAQAPSPLRFRLSWMLSAVIRYNLRWLLDVPPPSISAPPQGGDYLAIADVRSSVHTLIKVTPAPPAHSAVSLYTPSPPAAASTSRRAKPAAVDHCHVDTADVPLSALVTYALRQMDLERRFLARRAAPGAASAACAEGLDAAWRRVLGSAEVSGSLLAEVEALQVLLAAASGRAFLAALLALPCMAATPGARAGTATDPWSSIATSAALLQSLRADERHLTPLAVGPATLLTNLRESSISISNSSNSSSINSEGCLILTAAARLDEIRRTVGTKRGGGPATSAAAKERDSVRWELSQTGLIFDFPSLSEHEGEA